MPIDSDPRANAGLRFRSSLPSVQVDALVFQASPQPFHEDVVEEPAFAIHGDPHAGPSQPVRPGEGRELTALIGIHDLGRVEPGDGLGQRLNGKALLLIGSGMQSGVVAGRGAAPGAAVSPGVV